MKKLNLSLFFGLLCLMAFPVVAQNLNQSLTDHFSKLIEQDELVLEDANWLITNENVSRTSNLHHVYFNQTLNDIEIFGTTSSIHLLNGKVISENNQFVFKSTNKIVGTSSPSITAIQAVTNAAAQLNYSITEGINIIEAAHGTNQQTLLSTGGISKSAIPAKLVYHITSEDKLVLAWDISIQEIAQENWWSIRVDAVTGAILEKNNWIVSCSSEHDHSVHEELNYNKNLYDIPNYKTLSMETVACVDCYEVFPMPLESPYYGNRTIETNAANSIASPFGWHDTNGAAGAEFTVTRGNNVNAFEDGDNQGYQPDGGTDLDFTGYPFGQVYSNANQYEDAAITNLFFWNNIVHDVTYLYGFDEAGGNFQVNNYGNGGAGGDSVNAEGQKGITCNAFFGTPPDGSSPTMQMYVCNNNFNDGDFDNLVITHEYGHGISNRLTGGPGNVECLNNSEQMGEGWSDFFGVLLTIEPGDTGTDSRGVGTYLFGQGIGGAGIRPAPYSTDFAVNDFTYGDLPSQVVPHGVGFVWATMLWDVTWALIDEHGFDADFYNFTGDVNQDAGNVMAMALVIEALKLQPCSPGFVDGRDAIFAADLAIYGGANECLLWDAFAIRGLGASADQGSSNNSNDGVEAFDSPVPAINTEEEVCVGQGVQVFGGGTPAGGVYSGPGVTDDGNGTSYTFNPAVAGIGTHSIGYDVTTACASGTAFDDIEVITDVPEIICQDVTIELDANGDGSITIPDVVVNLLPGGMVVDQNGSFSPISISGTQVSLGDDEMSGAFPIGFDFNFYNEDYSNFYISANGFITFSSGQDDGCCNGGVIPSSADPNNLIAIAWEDINPSAGGTISYETVGTSPNRKLVVEFDNVPFYGTSDGVTSQIHLFEGSTRIEIHSTSIPSNGSVTQGIENMTGSDGVATPGRNSQTWSATNDFVAFYAVPGNTADNCGATTTVTLSEDTFNCLDVGTNDVIVTVDDGNGNTNTCTAVVTVTDPLNVCLFSTESNEMNQNIEVFPNPTRGQLTIINNSTVQLIAASITDVNGRVIKYIDLSDSSLETTLSLDNIATGMYFLKIESLNASIIKQIIKN